MNWRLGGDWRKLSAFDANFSSLNFFVCFLCLLLFELIYCCLYLCCLFEHCLGMKNSEVHGFSSKKSLVSTILGSKLCRLVWTINIGGFIVVNKLFPVIIEWISVWKNMREPRIEESYWVWNYFLSVWNYLPHAVLRLANFSFYLS